MIRNNQNQDDILMLEMEEAHYYSTISDFVYLMDKYDANAVLNELFNRIHLNSIKDPIGVLDLLDVFYRDVINLALSAEIRESNDYNQ